jgi:DNA-binding transcriptional ArsR family regulator
MPSKHERSAIARHEAVFGALADPMRSRVLETLATRGGATATEVAADLPVTRQAIVKHLGILNRAGLVTWRKEGRDVRYDVQVARLRDVARWLDRIASQWDRRLTRLKEMAERREP